MTQQQGSLFEDDNVDQPACTHIIRTVFETGADAEFDYFVPDRFWPILPGQRVLVPFGRGNKLQKAFCVISDIPKDSSYAASSARAFKLKIVKEVIDDTPLIDDQLLNLARWISEYYICPLGQVLAAMIPSAVKKGIGLKQQKLLYLADNYSILLESVKSKKQKDIVTFLADKGATSEEKAIPQTEIIGNVCATKGPLKKLADNMIIKVTSRQVFSTLPVVPDSMLLNTKTVTLNADQQNALEHINDQINNNQFAVTLLFGVTDSGKTEVYIRAVEQAIANGKTAIVLLPEIALTAQTVNRFSSRFKRLAVMHSGLTAAQRNAQWQRIKAGNADVVIGARSAVFAPLVNLGLIVVDEEHEPSYKQDSVPRYHGRDVAIKRAQLSNAVCLAGSATPSLETFHNCKTKKHFSIVELPNRVMSLPIPEIKLVDLKTQISKGNQINLITDPLLDQLKAVLSKKEQAILLLNRRGYSSFVMCSACKHTISCRNCDVTLTFHKKNANKKFVNRINSSLMTDGSAVCHHCGAKTLVRKTCPLCSKPMIMIGLGTQRLEEELIEKLPNAKIARVDSDSMQKGDYFTLLSDFANGKIDILAGTQMLAKGLHFPNVTLVGVISGDTSLFLPDFRANERTYQLISQVAGRTGRSEKKGVVLLQTILPDQPVIKFAVASDFEGFVNEELKHRKQCNLPPYNRMAIVHLRDRKYEKLTAAARAYRNKIDQIVENENLKIQTNGPMDSTIARIQTFHRMQIIVNSPTAADIQRLFALIRRSGQVRPIVKIVVDIDPFNLL